MLLRSAEVIGGQNCQSQLREEGWLERREIVEDVWLLLKVFGILQSDLAVGEGVRGWAKEGGAGNVKNTPRT